MFKFNLKITLRNLFNNKIYSGINLFGLSLGLTCAILVIIFIKAEFSVDKFLNNNKNIYRINVLDVSPDETYTTAQTPYPLGPALSNEFAGFEQLTRVYLATHQLVSYNNNKYFEDYSIFVDSSFFKIFSYSLISGDKNSVLNEPNSVVLTESIAKKYFGNTNPVGSIIKFNKSKELKVTGIVEDPPVNSSLKFDFVVNFKMLDASVVGFSPNQWGLYTSLYTFVKFNKNAELDKFEKQVKGILDSKVKNDPGFRHELKFQKITDINLDPSVYAGHIAPTNPSKLYILGSIGLFIILLACINFMNLATARASKRAKEVGVRKVLGAYRNQLVSQFLGESLIISFTSLFISIAFSELLIDHFSALVDIRFTSGIFGNPVIIVSSIILALLVGLLAGIYPALFLSKFKPVTVLKGSLSERRSKSSGAGLRKLLVVLQFSISIIFMIGMLIVNEQLNYLQNKDLGFKKNNRIILNAYEDTARTGYQAIKSELLSIPGVKEVTVGIKPPVSTTNFGTSGYKKGGDSGNKFSITFYFTEPDYIKDFGIQIISGRSFPDYFVEGDVKPAIVNEALIKKMGINNPSEAIGQQIVTGLNGWSMEIVGVIKDFNHASLHENINPLVFIYWPKFFYKYVIAISPGNAQKTLANINKVWQKFMPAYPFEYKYLSEEISGMYKDDQRTNDIITDFSVVALIIASLGIFGLVLFTAEQKTKEIGIRKVLGASIGNILKLISFDFLKLVLLANILAWPLGYYFMNEWLNNFAYHINLTAFPFILAGLITLFIAIITISYQSIKSAISNPVQSLRYE